MSDDLLHLEDRAGFGDIIAALEIALARGQQYYTMPVGGLWLVFYNGPARLH